MKKIIKLMFVLCVMFTMMAATSCKKEEKNAVGKELVTFNSQLDSLVQLKNGSVDACVIDSVMAGYYTNNGEFKDKIKIVDNLVLAEEEYGIAGRKNDKAFMEKINQALVDISEKAYADIAKFYGLTSEVLVTPNTTFATGATDDSWDKIVQAKKVIIGYTVFAPIAYTSSTESYSGNEFTGFDIELAKAVFNYLNNQYGAEIAVEFIEIDWDSKETLLENGSIDLIWNGLTITDERKVNMTISIPYLRNAQVVVVNSADAAKYTTIESLADCIIGAEAGSAGEEVVKGK